MKTTKKICGLAMMTALYVVLGAFLKIPLIGDIKLDLGYIAFAVALCVYGPWGALVGVIGCSLESILFSAYGFSISWAAANAAIGVFCGFTFKWREDITIRTSEVFFSGLIGLAGIKTGIECALYQIPLEVKFPKNAVAALADIAVMIAGLYLFRFLERKAKNGDH